MAAIPGVPLTPILISICNTSLLSVEITPIVIWLYIYFIGFTIAGPTALALKLGTGLAIIGAFLQYAVGQILYIFQQMIQWERPTAFLSEAQCPVATAYFNNYNIYGFPDFVTIPSYIFLIYVTYIFYKVGNTGQAILVTIVIAVLYVGHVVSDFLLQRIYVAQFICNFSVIVVISLAVCLSTHYLFSWSHEEILFHITLQIPIFVVPAVLNIWRNNHLHLVHPKTKLSRKDRRDAIRKALVELAQLCGPNQSQALTKV